MSDHLNDRACLRVGGADATHFLQNLVTCEIGNLDGLSFGALLTPQGKVLFDFFVSPVDGGYRLETLASARDDLIRRLTFYRLRAAVEIEPSDETVGWHETDGMTDPRAAAMGTRTYDGPSRSNADYHARRAAVGVPEAGHDFTYGDAFPHDVLMDQFETAGAGVARKGCYVGQEVVSRMEHRGTARRRTMRISASDDLPPPGTALKVGEREVGALGTVAGCRGLGIVRLDRVRDASVMVSEMPVTLEFPTFTRFSWP